MQDSFVTNLNRDAWAKIRGYVYQVNFTIKRLLNLKHGEILELERGEDIDIVNKALGTRQPEQIKHLEKNISLISGEISDTIISSYEHKVNNPGHVFKFLFVTNASVTNEKKSMPKGSAEKLILKWNEPSALNGDILTSIHGILKGYSKPSKISDATWQAWEQFINNCENNELIAFIRQIEFSTNNLNYEELIEDLKVTITNKYSVESKEAEDIYLRLFFLVFNTLSKSGLKTLSEAELNSELKLVLDNKELEFLGFARVLIFKLDKRLTKLEQEFEELKQDVQGIDERVVTLEKNVMNDFFDIIKQVFPTQDLNLINRLVVDFDEPELVSNFSERKEQVKQIITVLDNGGIYHIFGTPASGKTQLALLAAKKINWGSIWINFENEQDLNKAYLMILTSFSKLFGENLPDYQLDNYFQKHFEKISQNCKSIIIENLPKITDINHIYTKVLIKFLKSSLKFQNIKVITTGLFDFPEFFKEKFLDNTLKSEKIKPFNLEEIIEILIKETNGQINDKAELINLIYTFTKGDPVFVNSMIKFLKDKNWDLDDQTFQAIISGNYASDTKSYFVNLFSNMVQEPEVKNLFYRLDLIHGKFTNTEVSLVGNISPEITFPHEKLNKLLDLWIQREKSNYQVLPLIKDTGKLNLPNQTFKDINFALADSIMFMNEKSYYDAVKAFFYFVNAEEKAKAATLLVTALLSLLKEKSPIKDIDYGLTKFWTGNNLPSDLELYLKIFIRTFQIRIFEEKLQEDSSFLLNDLDSLLKQADPSDKKDILGIGAACIMLGVLSENNKPKYLKYLFKISKPSNYVQNIFRKSNLKAEQLIWTSLFKIKDEKYLDDWVEIFRELTDEQKTLALSYEIEREVCISGLNNFWMREEDKPEENRNWAKLLNIFKNLTKKAEELKLNLILAGSARIEVIILAEYIKQMEEAIMLALTNIPKLENDPVSKYILTDILGKEYYYRGDYSNSQKYLIDSIKINIGDKYIVDKIRTYVFLAMIFGNTDPNTSLAFTRQAVELVEQSKVLPTDEKVKILGEYAITLWKKDNSVYEAYSPLQEGAERLLEIETNTNNWKGLFIVYSNVAGYFFALQSNSESVITFQTPFQGIFMNLLSKESIHFNAHEKANFPLRMCLLSEEVKEYENAKKWAELSYKFALESKTSHVLSSVGIRLLTNYAISKDYSKVIKLIEELGQNFTNKIAIISLVNFLIMPYFFNLAEIYITNQETARDQLTKFSTEIEKLHNNCSFKSHIKESIQLISDVFDKKKSKLELMQESTTFFKTGLTYNWAIYFVGLTLYDEVNPLEALKIHIQFSEIVFLSYKTNPVFFNESFAPFFKTYWQNQLIKNKDKFKNFAELANDLLEAFNLEPLEKVKKMLFYIATSLGLSIDGKLESMIRAK